MANNLHKIWIVARACYGTAQSIFLERAPSHVRRLGERPTCVGVRQTFKCEAFGPPQKRCQVVRQQTMHGVRQAGGNERDLSACTEAMLDGLTDVSQVVGR